MIGLKAWSQWVLEKIEMEIKRKKERKKKTGKKNPDTVRTKQDKNLIEFFRQTVGHQLREKLSERKF